MLVIPFFTSLHFYDTSQSKHLMRIFAQSLHTGITIFHVIMAFISYEYKKVSPT